MKLRFACVVCLYVFGFLGDAKAGSSLAGHWRGTIRAAGSELGLIVHFDEAGAGWKGTLDVPAQGAAGLPIDEVRVVDGELRLTLNRLKASFQGVLNATRNEASGTWKQAGSSLELVLKKESRVETLTIPEPLKGTWEGRLGDGGFGLRIGMRLEVAPNGTVLAGFASPDQGQKFRAINAVTFDGKSFKADSELISASYSGNVNVAKTEIVGTWSQNGAKIPLTLKRSAKLSEPERPQTPKPPFPYEAIEVEYPNESAKITLAGTLTIPRGNGPFPAVVMITGSGAQDRDETLFGHKPFWVIADFLTRKGVAVLRVDDRGVGKSTGTQADATSLDFATDVSAGVAYLKTRKEIDSKAIGLIGHSEGGIIAPIVAGQSKDVAFLVLMAGTGVKGTEILKAQNRHAVSRYKLSDNYLKLQDRTLDTIYEVALAERDEAKALATLRDRIKQPANLTSDEQKAFAGYTGKSLELAVNQLNQAWYRFFLTHDPATSLAKVQCPVLALNGERDMQVPSQINLRAIERALTSSGNTRVKIVERPGLNHLFQPCKTGAPSEYATITQTFEPETLKLMADWILETTRKK